MPLKSARRIDFRVESADAMAFAADVLALKYAQGSYGLDAQVLSLLSAKRTTLRAQMPAPGQEILIPTNMDIKCPLVLFVGVEPIRQFGYQEIRAFGQRILRSLAVMADHTTHVCLTLHGTGYGLDEAEAFKAEIAGLLDAISAGQCPPGLEAITFLVRHPQPAQRLNRILRTVLPKMPFLPDARLEGQPNSEAAETLRSVGAGSNAKAHVFVAMPFLAEMGDTFHYGIEPAVKTVAAICERADQAIFTGEIMAWIKERIDTAVLVVADLTGANANVYLEVGYAWGRGVPTVLLTRDVDDLKFDVRAVRCIVYDTIQNLEILLEKELAVLFPK